MSVDNRALINSATVNTSWAGDDTANANSDAGSNYEGGDSLSTQLSNALERMTYSGLSAADMSNGSVWFLVKDNLGVVKASGGAQIVLVDATPDEIGFYVGGNDSPGLQLPSYFQCLKLDVSNRAALSNNAYVGSAGALADTAITGAGYGTLHAAKAVGSIDNVWMDASYWIANTSYGLTINGGTVGTPETWTDVTGDDVTNGWGFISNLQGSKIDINTSWEWGDVLNADSFFVDSDFQVYIDARDMGVGNFIVRTIAGSGTNVLELTSGLFQNLGTASVWDLTDTGMNELKFTGITFTDVGTIAFPVVSASNRFANDCIFNNCGQVNFSTMDADGCTFNGTTDALGAVLWNAATNEEAQDNLTFNSDGTGHAIEIALNTASLTTYNISGYAVSGYETASDGSTGNTVFLVDNLADGDVTINVTGGTGTFSYERAAGYTGTVSIIQTVNVLVGGVTEGAAIVIIANETLGAVTLGDVLLEALADSAGEASFSHNYEGDLDIIVRGAQQGIANAAIADDGAVLTDETTESNSTTTADMNLLPATPLTNDAYYFAHNEEFNRLKIDVTNANGGTGTLAWQYWNGAWTALGGVVDATNDFTTVGRNMVSFTLPGDWIDTTINSQGPFRYIRAVFTAGAGDDNALARKATLDVTRYLSTGDQPRTILGTGLTTVVPWSVDTISKFDPSD